MATNLTKYKKDLSELLLLGNRMYADLEIRWFEKSQKLTKELSEVKKQVEGSFEKNIIVGTLKHKRSFDSFYQTVKTSLRSSISLIQSENHSMPPRMLSKTGFLESGLPRIRSQVKSILRNIRLS